MVDLVLTWNPATGDADLSIVNGDLALDQGLVTAVIVSLFTDAPADPGDDIPDGSGDPRGYWGDMPVAAASQTGAPPDVTGSKLWLLDRALVTTETLARAESYAKACLAWMIRDGVAGAVNARAISPRLGWIELFVQIVQAGGAPTFTFAWQNS